MSIHASQSCMTQQLRQPKGNVLVYVGGLFVFFLFWVHATPLPAAHLGREARSLQRDTPLAVPHHGNPGGLLWQPGLHVGSVSWSGDKFLLVYRKGVISIASCGGKRCDECFWLCNLANICLTTTTEEKGFLNEIYQQITASVIIWILSPAYYCF